MVTEPTFKFDKISYWSEVKLEIVRDYAAAYSKILSAQTKPQLYHVYVDAFSGAGEHRTKTSGAPVPGSPLNALSIAPPFREYHLIDLNPAKVAHLRDLVGDRQDVHVYEGNCNEILLRDVFPKVRYEDYRRGLCLLDPYGLHLDWSVISAAGKMRSLDMFLNFPVMDMNRNVLWRKRIDEIGEGDRQRMNAFWGDDSWTRIVYKESRGLFDTITEKVPNANETIAQAFRKRLIEVAGFENVPEPLPMRNSTGAIVYYLYFASQKGVAMKIVKHIFDKYRERAG